MKDIPGYEGLYAATDEGKIWGYKRQHYLLEAVEKGYCRVSLCKDGNVKRYNVHRLVAMAFIPNPDNLPEVNHKNEIKTDNSVSNLEWVSKSANCSYGNRNNKAYIARTNREGGFNRGLRKPVYCEELETVYDSVKEAAAALDLHDANITMVCKGQRKTTGGYHFRYAD